MKKKVNLVNSKKFLKNYKDEYFDSIKFIIDDISNIISNNLAAYNYKNKIKILNKYVKLNIMFKNLPNTIEVSGVAEHTTNSIKITIRYPYTFGVDNLHIILSETADCIRHEIEHFVQHTEYKFQETLYNNIPDKFMYYLSPHEIEAHIYGFIYNIKYKACSTTLKNHITDFFKHLYTLTPIQKEILLEKYKEVIILLFHH